MISGFKALVSVFVILTFVPPCAAGNLDGDKWFGRDKLKHFGLSAFFSGGSCIVASRHFDLDRGKSVTIGIGITISLGAAKEITDYRIPGQTSSHKDLIWDIAGAVTGALLVGLAL